MTEAEWLECTDLPRMLKFLRGKVSARKLRLFACACCRRIGHLLDDERSRNAVETAERYADGLAGADELAAAQAAAWAAAEDQQGMRARNSLEWSARVRARRAAAWAAAGSCRPAQAAAVRAAELEQGSAVAGKAGESLVETWRQLSAVVPAALAPAAWQAMSLPAWKAVQTDQAETRRASDAGASTERRGQRELLRDLIGNPFRPTFVDPSLLAWNDGAVRKLARAIYEGRRFADLPILADALEEAGCSDPEILGHCRGGGEHLRGCWVLDRLLDRE